MKKFLFPVAAATFAALASAGGGTNPCSELAEKVPICANDCVNKEAAKFCDSSDYDCICATETLDKIFDASEDCVAKACKSVGPVFPPLRDYCQCLVPETKPPTPTTTSTPEPTPSCAAEEEKIPDCAQDCVNNAAYKYCKPGELDCSCAPETLEKIIEDSTDCVAKACKHDAKIVFPLLRDFCECAIGDDDDDDDDDDTPSTSSTPVEPTETSSTSSPAEPTTSETSKPEPTTSTFVPVPTPTEIETETPEEPPSETCAADETETVTVTTTVCPEETPGEPGPTSVPVPPSPSTPVIPPPPGFTGAAAVTQRNAGLVAGVVAVVAGAAYF